MDELQAMVEAIAQLAAERGLSLFRGLPLFHDSTEAGGSPYPIATWQGDWPGYLDLAAEVGAKLVYIEAPTFDLEEEIRSVIEEQNYDDQPETDEEGNRTDEFWILHQRLIEHVDQWRQRTGQTLEVHMYWLAAGVAHQWIVRADWFVEFERSIESLITEFLAENKQSETDDRRTRREETDQRIQILADELVRHERFPEANNDARRQFLSKKLFPDEPPFIQHKVAELASLIYWRDIEPEKRATKTEQAREMYRKDGATIRHIAAVLHMPEARVREAISDPTSKLKAETPTLFS